jgi:hypothetical protein
MKIIPGGSQTYSRMIGGMKDKTLDDVSYAYGYAMGFHNFPAEIAFGQNSSYTPEMFKSGYEDGAGDRKAMAEGQ